MFGKHGSGWNTPLSKPDAEPNLPLTCPCGHLEIFGVILLHYKRYNGCGERLDPRKGLFVVRETFFAASVPASLPCHRKHVLRTGVECIPRGWYPVSQFSYDLGNSAFPAFLARGYDDIFRIHFSLPDADRMFCKHPSPFSSPGTDYVVDERIVVIYHVSFFSRLQLSSQRPLNLLMISRYFPFSYNLAGGFADTVLPTWSLIIFICLAPICRTCHRRPVTFLHRSRLPTNL